MDARLNFTGFLRQFFAYGQGGARFHASGDNASFGGSVAFHLQLPRLIGSELVRNGPRRGVSLLILLALWEIANLAGFLTIMSSRPALRSLAVKAEQRENEL